MIRSVLGSRASIGGVLGSGRGGAAAAWWLAGGVSAANCVAAYQPIGAATLAASYVNLANPGTYTATPGVAPTLGANGWTFDGTQYLSTGLVLSPATLYTAIVRYSDFAETGYNVGTLVGVYDSTPLFRYYFAVMIGGPSNPQVYQFGQRQASANYGGSPAATSGVLAMAGLDCYFNGSSLGTIGSSAAIASIDQPLWIGGRNLDGVTNNLLNGSMQAIAIYNVTLDAATVAAISSAMSAL